MGHQDAQEAPERVGGGFWKLGAPELEPEQVLEGQAMHGSSQRFAGVVVAHEVAHEVVLQPLFLDALAEIACGDVPVLRHDLQEHRTGEYVAHGLARKRLEAHAKPLVFFCGHGNTEFVVARKGAGIDGLLCDQVAAVPAGALFDNVGQRRRVLVRVSEDTEHVLRHGCPRLHVCRAHVDLAAAGELDDPALLVLYVFAQHAILAVEFDTALQAVQHHLFARLERHWFAAESRRRIFLVVKHKTIQIVAPRRSAAFLFIVFFHLFFFTNFGSLSTNARGTLGKHPCAQ